MNEIHSPRPHLLVSASAGSGKTYQLVRRLIGLLADSESPESILAATFSRKAAGEFRSKLLKAVADAALHSEQAGELAAEIGHPEWKQDDFLALLRSLVRDPDALRLSTIDAFFLEVIGLFRLDLGLGTELRMAPETADDFDTRDLLRTIFTAAEDHVRQAVFHLIQEDRGAESVRGFQSVLEQWISDSLSLYRTSPEAEKWGSLPPGITLPTVSLEQWQDRFKDFESKLRAQDLPEESLESIDNVLEILGNWDLSPSLPATASKWMEAGAHDRQKLIDGKKYFVLNGKRVTPSSETGEALVHLAGIFHAQVLQIARQNTQGAHVFLEMFNAEYEKRRLASGLIRFADLPYLLSELGEFENTALAYRLDASLKHWLLDEFQDTSRSQWKVIQPLIDELFYDDQEFRSFFCVGDPKQAIYGWRQGDSRLFGEIFSHYQHFEPRPLQAEVLAKTYRCAPAIVAFTNKLFGSSESFPSALDPVVVDRWMNSWSHHESASVEPEGYVEVHVAGSDDSRDQGVVDFLLEEQPWKRGQTAAILCRKNDAANRFEALLRANHIPTVRDGALAISRDFQVGRILHAIFQVLVHPGDTAALMFLRDSSASEALTDFFEGEITAKRIRSRWEMRSVDNFLAGLEKTLTERGLMDESENRCLRVVRSLIHDLQSSPSGELREILRAIEHGRIEDTGDSESVQILSIHRSKGLEFDLVILPDIDSGSGGGNSKEFWVQEENGHVLRILENVTKAVQATFPPLESWANSVEQDRALENLCVHYVAITRAATSLHLFLGDKKRKSSTGIHKWIERAFEIEAVEGSILTLGKPVEAKISPEKTLALEEFPSPEPPVLSSEIGVRARRLVTPSRGKKEKGRSLFMPGSSSSLSLGRRVHEVLSSYEWPGTDLSIEDHDPEVSEILKEALGSPAVKALLSPTGAPVKVWRERAFEACIGKAWSSGVFDRVHLPEGWENGDGRPLIIDFKTDRTTGDSVVDSYRDQMHLYRRALAMILGISEDQIDAKLVFLRSGTVVESSAFSLEG